MKRTTVFMDEAVERDLQALARQADRPMASLVREALAEYIAARQSDSPLVPGFVGAGNSGRRDVSERHEELLWREVASAPCPTAPSRPVRPAARRRPRRP